jgi:hypothetical protein
VRCMRLIQSDSLKVHRLSLSINGKAKQFEAKGHS